MTDVYKKLLESCENLFNNKVISYTQYQSCKNQNVISKPNPKKELKKYIDNDILNNELKYKKLVDKFEKNFKIQLDLYYTNSLKKINNNSSLPCSRTQKAISNSNKNINKIFYQIRKEIQNITNIFTSEQSVKQYYDLVSTYNNIQEKEIELEDINKNTISLGQKLDIEKTKYNSKINIRYLYIFLIVLTISIIIYISIYIYKNIIKQN